MPFSSTPVYVGLGDQVEIRYPTPSTWNTKVTVNVQIGTGSDPDGIIFGTRIPDARPDLIVFNDQLGSTTAGGTTGNTFEKATTYYSNEVLVNGIEIEIPAVLSCTTTGPKGTTTGTNASAAFRINRGGSIGPWITSGNVRQGDLLMLRVTTENWYTTNTNVTLTLSNETWGTSVGLPSAVVSDTWSITTRAQDQVIPNYTFTDYVDVRASDFNTFKTQNIQITGIDSDVVLRASATGDGQVSKDGTNWSQSVTGLVTGSILYTRLPVGSTYTTKKTSNFNVFAQGGDTLAGGYENNNTGTYGSGSFAVTQTLGTVTDTWQLWTEVDRYPNAISISPIFTESDDNLVLAPPGIPELVTVSSTNTLNNAEISRVYYANIPISGLGTEYTTGTYSDLESPLDPTYLSSLLPLNTALVNGADVELLCSVSSGSAEIRKNNTGSWVQQLYVKNSDTINLRLTSSSSYNTTVTSGITLAGPPAAGPNGNPTAGPQTPTFPNKTDTITIKTRLARSTPYPFKVQDVWDAAPSVTYIDTVPMAGLDLNATAQIIDASSTPGTNAQLSVDGTNYAKTVTVTPTTQQLYIRATSSTNVNTLSNVVYQVGTYQDTFKLFTRKTSWTYTSFDGAGATNFQEYDLPDFAGTFDFVIIGAGGGAGGDDAPNSYGGRGGFGNIIRGTITLPENILNDPTKRLLKIFPADSGKSGNGFLDGGGASGGAAGWGYATGGNGGSAGPNDRSGAGGGGGGASAICLGDGTLLVLAGGGGGAGGAGNDTTIPQATQNGNNGGFGTLTSVLNGLNLTGANGPNNTLRGGGAGGAGGGYGTAGTLNTQKVDQFGGVIQTIDLDANGGTGGGGYYSPYVTLASTNNYSNFGASESVAGFVLIAYAPQDNIPDPFNIPQIDAATPNTVYESAKVQITGITGNVLVSTTGNSSQVRTCDASGNNCGAWGSSVVITNNRTIQVRLTTGANYFSAYSATVLVGSTSQFFTVNTGDPPDLSPSIFDVPDKINQPINTLVVSDPVLVSGINVPVNITASNGAQISICNSTGNNCDAFAASPRTITNGQSFKLRLLSSPSYSISVSSDITVGDSDIVNWEVRTISAPDLTPVGFLFTDLFDQPLNTFVTSETRTVQGISTTINMTVTGGASVILNGDIDNPFNPVSGTTTVPVNSLDTIALTYTTSSIVGDVKTFIVTVGTYQTDWNVSNTGQLGTSPTPFTFAPVLATGALVFTPSNETITISGLSTTVGIFGTSGLQVQINGGAWQTLTFSNQGVISNGNTLRVRLRSSEVSGFTLSGAVYVGSYNTIFTVGTPGGVQDPLLGQWYSSLNIVRDFFGSPIKYNTKLDGLPVGSIMPVFRDGTQDDGWGVSADKLNGKADSRFPSWIYCDGRFLSKTSYALLYKVLGDYYGVNASEFRLPDFRNRKLLGTGNVDSAAPSSPVVIPEYGPRKILGQGSAQKPGSFGGMWYIDKISTPGVDELEQVYTPGTGQPAQESPFFAVAQITTAGYTDVSDNIEFLTIGSVTGAISLRDTTLYEVPFHQHLLVTGQADPGNFKGRVSWGSFGGAQGPVNIGQKATGAGASATPPLEGSVSLNLWGYFTGNTMTLNSSDTIRTTNSASYGPVWVRVVGVYNLCEESRKGEYLDPGDSQGPSSEGTTCTGGLFFSAPCGDPVDAQIWNTITLNWPNSAKFGEIYNYIDQTALPSDSTSGDNRRWIGAITIPRRNISIQKWAPTTKIGHSHYVSLTAIDNTVTKFSYGNVIGFGTIPSGQSYNSSVNVTFQAADVGLEVFPGQFVLGEGKQLIPTPSFIPNSFVPLVTPYTQVKWLIKTF